MGIEEENERLERGVVEADMNSGAGDDDKD